MRGSSVSKQWYNSVQTAPRCHNVLQQPDSSEKSFRFRRTWLNRLWRLQEGAAVTRRVCGCVLQQQRATGNSRLRAFLRGRRLATRKLLFDVCGGLLWMKDQSGALWAACWGLSKVPSFQSGVLELILPWSLSGFLPAERDFFFSRLLNLSQALVSVKPQETILIATKA